MMSQMEGGCPVDYNTITDLFLQVWMFPFFVWDFYCSPKFNFVFRVFHVLCFKVLTIYLKYVRQFIFVRSFFINLFLYRGTWSVRQRHFCWMFWNQICQSMHSFKPRSVINFLFFVFWSYIICVTLRMYGIMTFLFTSGPGDQPRDLS